MRKLLGSKRMTYRSRERKQITRGRVERRKPIGHQSIDGARRRFAIHLLCAIAHEPGPCFVADAFRIWRP
ncbi:hypothetical protein OKW38_001371 [Paraburkholderia sp. MM5496-R1]|uniref:hypothetical protein n=1 Tax=Paraburkholderia sp. MM5496-R1 TaxID=2991065 RepID=UPI003D1C1942